MYVFHRVTLRIRRILVVTFIALGALIICLFHLQIAQTQRFSELSQRNFMRHEKIASPRGNITDQHGTLLATNKPTYGLYWSGSGSASLTPEHIRTITQLTTLCHLDEVNQESFSLAPLLTFIEHAQRRSKKVLLKAPLEQEELTRIIEQIPLDKELCIRTIYERHYPYNQLACHIVGYLGIRNNPSGKMGLELLYNTKLQGHAGILLKITNSVGHALKAHTVAQALQGETLTTTLDLTLQKIAEEVFPPETDGCMILMDGDGALEVVLSRPSFDPSLFLKPVSHDQWQLLQKNQGFMNRAFSACYPPASLFKIVTLAAGLETNRIAPTTQWNCTGHFTYKGRDYHCSNRTGHGPLSTKQAFAHSCNIPFFEIGRSLPIDTLAHYARLLGLGTKTGIEFPEKLGLIPTTDWKRRVRKERWWQGETLSAAIGQSSLLVTPLQMGCMIASVSTGYRVRPRILIDEPIIHEPLELRPQTLSFLQECLSSVITQGNGTALSTLRGFTIKGKSGTAQVAAHSSQPLSKKFQPHGYFVAHFQYMNEKPRTLVVFLENAGSSRYAIDVARKFMARYKGVVDTSKH